jgi:hypothetical protein
METAYSKTPNLIPRKAKTNQTETHPEKKIVGTVYEHFWNGNIIMVFVGYIFSLKQPSTAVFRYQIRMPWEYLTSGPSCQTSSHISILRPTNEPISSVIFSVEPPSF